MHSSRPMFPFWSRSKSTWSTTERARCLFAIRTRNYTFYLTLLLWRKSEERGKLLHFACAVVSFVSLVSLLCPLSRSSFCFFLVRRCSRCARATISTATRPLYLPQLGHARCD